MALSLKGISGVPETRKNIPNIGGSVVRLGDLYDGRKDLVIQLNYLEISPFQAIL